MPRKHSSDSDDLPLDSYKPRNCLHKSDSLPCEFCDNITSTQLRKHSSESDDVPLNSYKVNSTLHKPDSLPCDFCDHISTSIYANFKHNATHIVIPLVNLTLHQCEDCLHHFTSLEELTTHAKAKNHKTSQVTLKTNYDIILQSFVQKQLVIKCHDLFNDIKQNSGKSQNSTEVSKETNPENYNTVSKTMISDNVTVKLELPTYVISDSDSNGRNSPIPDTERQNTKQQKEQRQTKLKVSQIKPKHSTYNQPESETENVQEGNGEQTSVLHKEGRSVSPLHRKWEHSSDSDSKSDIKAELNLTHLAEDRSVSPPHRKWEHTSDSGSDFDANINEDSQMKFYHSDEEITEVDQSVFKNTTLDGSSSPKFKSSPVHEPTRSRLVFEDDLDDDFAEEILPDIPSRALPNMYLLGKATCTNFKPNSIILGSQMNGITVKNKVFGNGVAVNRNNLKISDSRVEQIDLEEYPASVPYETLVKTQICDCRYCGRCFCNRIQLITHEATHLRIRKPRPNLCVYCERFYPGYKALRKHVEAKHPEIDPDEKKPLTRMCKMCNLSYYSISRHEKYYHKHLQENPPSATFRRYRYRTIKVCDMCLNWVKNDHIYTLVGSHHEIGTTQKCCKCENRHFSINLVTKRRFGYKADGTKSLSNEDRLMRIKKKLKMIKRMNKCFCSCFIRRLAR